MTATLTTPTGRVLRDYQAEAVEMVFESWSDPDDTRPAIVMATGLGKTDVIAATAQRCVADGKRVLILAHREELLDQITERCRMHDPTVPVGRVQASRHEPRRPIVVAMAPTMRTAKRRARCVVPDVVIVDECHHAAAPSYRATLEWAGCFDPARRTPLLGVTATFTRDDKYGLGSVFTSVPFTRDIVFGIDEGYLVRPHGKVVTTSHMDLDQAKVSRGDYQDGELGEMVAQDVEEIVKAWCNHAENRLTVAFTPSVDSAAALAAAFRAQGVPVGEVYGSTKTPERQRVYGDLAAGRIRILINVMVATEGWDSPPVSCVLMARPTKLKGLYQQIVGRGLRLSPETGKSDCLVLDVVGASRTQTLASLVDLIPDAKVDTMEIDLIPCPECLGYVGRKPAVVEAAEGLGMHPCSCPCPVCGEEFDGAGRCHCPPEGGVRDPDGGRRRLQGPAQYESLDLLGLGAGESGSEWNWLTTAAGHPFLSAKVVDRNGRERARFGCLHQEENGLWTAATVSAYGALAPELLVEYASREHAVRLVEQWAEENGAFRRTASWRVARQRASDGQIAMAGKLGIEDPQGYTKGGISDAMDVVRASRQLDRAES